MLKVAMNVAGSFGRTIPDLDCGSLETGDRRFHAHIANRAMSRLQARWANLSISDASLPAG
jgi:hypothetical protein